MCSEEEKEKQSSFNGCASFNMKKNQQKINIIFLLTPGKFNDLLTFSLTHTLYFSTLLLYIF